MRHEKILSQDERQGQACESWYFPALEWRVPAWQESNTALEGVSPNGVYESRQVG
jgi:hypothetical protein